jgi:hypothetical protein
MEEMFEGSIVFAAKKLVNTTHVSKQPQLANTNIISLRGNRPSILFLTRTIGSFFGTRPKLLLHYWLVF